MAKAKPDGAAVPEPHSLILDLRVVPNAGRDALVGRMGEAYNVKVRAPAVDGKANEARLAFLASELGLRPSQIRLVSGEKSRTKRIAFAVPDAARADAILG